MRPLQRPPWLSWVTVTLPFSIHLSLSVPVWLSVAKTLLMTLVALAAVRTEKQTQIFLWIFVLSVGVFGIKGGVFAVLTGGEFYPADAIGKGLLTNGPKRYRVLVPLDATGKLQPVALVVDNKERTVAYVPTSKLGSIAHGVASEPQARKLTEWAACFRSEQAGLGGRA